MWTLLMFTFCSFLQEDMRPSHCHNLCSENERFVNNVNPQNTCEDGEMCALATVGGPGCDCMPGFYRNNKGKCVLKEGNEGTPPSQGNGVQKMHCRKDEVFLECSCEKTCCNGGQPEGCTASCKKGCFCRNGLVRHEDGRCIRLKDCDKNKGQNGPGEGPPPVKCSMPKCATGCSIDYTTKPCPSCSCPNNCGANAEYQECGSACPPTCADYDKKDMMCTMQCVSGCFCKKGFVKNDQGVCVKPEECPQDTCGANAEYLECGSACPPTCSDRGKKLRICTTQCVPGCFCKKGFMKNNRGECVRPQQCEQNTCGKNEVYSECGSACPATCANLGENVICTMQCVPGCFCARGLVRNDEGKCVPSEQCPQRNPPGMCNEDEEYQTCGSACPPTCENMDKNLPCTLQCVKGCFCKEGLVRNNEGKCVKREECPQKTCCETEVYLTCGSACPPTCSTLGRKDFACIALCVPGCFCKEGLVRNDEGDCVRPEECPRKTCGNNEEYLTCGSPCPISCSSLEFTSFACLEGCVPGCFCKKGLIRNDQGFCVPPEECPQNPNTQCGPRQQFYECIPRCSRTCVAYKRKSKVHCRPICYSGCFCREGLYETKDGKCVPPSQCPAVPPKEKCPTNEVYSDCMIPCNDCQTRGKCNFLVCNKGCDCRKGYYRDFSGRCIPARQCPIIEPTPPTNTCNADEQYYECIPSCDGTCKAYRRKEKIFCNQICISGCFCRKGLYLADDSKTCVPPEQCNQTPTAPSKICPMNEVYSDCVIPCNDCQTRGKCNFLVCNKGCDCKEGYYRDFEGQCIPAWQCPIIEPTPTPAECRPDQQIYDCIPRCSRTCQAYTRPLEIYCGLVCIKGCFCKEGLYEAEDGSCVPPEQCPVPTTPPEEQCPNNEMYSECVNPCNDCEMMGNCEFLICNKGCDCMDGYYRDFYGQCIPAEQCPLIDPTPPPNQCGVDEQFYDCIPGCQQTCFALTSEVAIACRMPCRSGCYCREGLYQKDDGTCVPPEECYDNNPVTPTLPAVTPTQTPICAKNEEYYKCKPTCRNTCDNYQAEISLCPRICIAGCSCKRGYVRNNDEQCVKPENCNKSSPTTKPTKPMNQTCGPNEQYYQCIPTCKNTCENYDAERPICPLICIKGCACKKGLVRRSDGKCVKPKNCNKSPPSTKPTLPPTKAPRCAKNEEYYNCKPTCRNTCENYKALRPICPRICIKGCACRKGFVRRNDGKCVKPEKCNKSITKPTSMPPPTNYDCMLPKDSGPCMAIFPRFYYNQKTGQCEEFTYGGCAGNKNNFLSKEDCEKACRKGPTPSPPKCGKNEEYYGCVPNCHNTCDTYNQKGPCPLFCMSGCFCKKGMVKNKEGKCVNPSKCPSSKPPTGKECGENEEYYDKCAPKCTGTCRAYNNPGIYHCPLCRPGCWCIKGFVKNDDDKCVPTDQCSASNSTTKPPGSNQVCQQPKKVGPCKARVPRFFYCQETQQCEPFEYGGCRGNGNNFNTKEECESKCGSPIPTPTPTPMCRSDEQFYECMPNCHNTCDSYNKTNIACPAICGSGCFCKEGLVKNDQGACVSPSECQAPQPPEECREDEEYYDECAPKCMGTCEAYNNPGIYNCPLCKPGCWCSKGLVKRSDGQCVPPEQCNAPSSTEPPDQCAEDEIYYEDCAPSCGGTCETYKKRPILNCRLCRPGCWCSKDMVKRKDGKCVPTDQCDVPTDMCGENEEYNECGSACPPTCSNPGNDDQMCTMQCVPGCFCKDGLVRNDQGECVEPEDCPPKTCSDDEEYKDCGSACPLTCSNPDKDQICTDECVQGCFCREGLVRNDMGECVEPEECPQKTPEECGENETFYDCTPSCGGTCDTYNNTALILCEPCGPGCWCNEGLVKNDEGKCIPPEQCEVPKEPNKLCGVNEIYYDECAPSCRGSCDTYNQTIECPECTPGCWCKKGFLKNRYGKCVKEHKCNTKRKIPHCTGDQQYYDCIPLCKRTCMTYNSTNAYCPKKDCIRGCFCKDGLVMNKKGECVRPEACPLTCPLNQKYYDCMPDCVNKCHPPEVCAAVCKSGCFCREGLVMREDGKCVRKALCKGKHPGKPHCGPNQEYYDCFQSCRNTCSTRKGVCPAMCESGCFCKRGLMMDSQGNCVQPHECDKCSGVNEEMVPCAKPKTCNTCLIRGNCKLKRCKHGCDCKSGYYRDHREVCIPQDQCPGASPRECSGQNEEMVDCAKPKWCNTCGIRGNCKLKECEGGCDCMSGYYRDDKGSCIPEDQCPGDTTDGPKIQCSIPKCGDDCTLDYNSKPCPSCSCPNGPKIQCSIPKCGDDCTLDYTSKPCPSCSCPNDSNNNPGGTSETDNENGSFDESSYSEESFSISETEISESESESMSQSSNIQKRSSGSQSGSGSFFSESSAENEIDYEKTSSDESGVEYSWSSSGATEYTSDMSSDSENSSSGSRMRSSSTSSRSEENSTENEFDSDEETVVTEDISLSDSESSTTSRSEENSTENEFDSDEESVVTEDISLSDSESGYSTISSDSEIWSSDMSDDSKRSESESSSGSRTWSENDSSGGETDSINESSGNDSSSGRGTGYSRSSSGSEDWSSMMAADSENSSLNSQSGSLMRSSKMSSDFDNEGQEYEEFFEEDFYEDDQEMLKENENKMEEYSYSFTEDESNAGN